MRLVTRRAVLPLAVAGLAFAASKATASALPPGRRIALKGYDPVAYFTLGKPQKGTDAFWYPFDDAVYMFASEEHRARFVADPERYAPQYAGFCAGGVSKGYKVEPDPEAWAVINGKLFLFEFKERVPMFKQDTAFIDKADKNWPGLQNAAVR